MVCGGIVIVGPDGVPRPGRPYILSEEENRHKPPTGPPLHNLAELLEDAKLTHLADVLSKSGQPSDLFAIYMEEGRPAFLTSLKTAGVEALKDRQAFANALSKAGKAGRLVTEEMPVATRIPDIADACATDAKPSPPPPPPPPIGATAGARMLSMHNWVVAGDTDRNGIARQVANKLETAGRTVHRVNPNKSTLQSVGKPIDVIDLIVNSFVGLKVMEQAHSLGVKKVFIQPGASSPQIEAYCKEKSIEVWHGCVLREL